MSTFSEEVWKHFTFQNRRISSKYISTWIQEIHSFKFMKSRLHHFYLLISKCSDFVIFQTDKYATQFSVLCNISTAPSTLSRTLFGSLWTFVGCLFKLNPMFQDKLWFLSFFNWTKKLVCCDMINSIMKCRKRKFVCLYVHMMVVMWIIFT